VNDTTHIDQSARRSRAVVHGGIACLAGQVADDAASADMSARGV